jgi:hypothetical protein
MVWLSFKCSGENFAELTERAGIIPAPYLARAQWVALETKEALRKEELSGLLREAYELVFAKLPKKRQRALLQGRASNARQRASVKSRASKSKKSLVRRGKTGSGSTGQSPR